MILRNKFLCYVTMLLLLLFLYDQCKFKRKKQYISLIILYTIVNLHNLPFTLPATVLYVTLCGIV